MPIDRISFSTSQEYVNPHSGLRSWKKFGGRYKIEEGETREEARVKLKSYVYESLKAQQDTVPEDVIQTKPPDTTNTGTIELINKCTTIPKPDGLMAYQIIAKTDKAIQQAWDEKFKELSQQTK